MRDARLATIAAQVVALRAQIDALATTIQAMQFDEPDMMRCRHLHKENIGTIGLPTWRCQDCGAVVNEEDETPASTGH